MLGRALSSPKILFVNTLQAIAASAITHVRFRDFKKFTRELIATAHTEFVSGCSHAGPLKSSNSMRDIPLDSTTGVFIIPS